MLCPTGAAEAADPAQAAATYCRVGNSQWGKNGWYSTDDFFKLDTLKRPAHQLLPTGLRSNIPNCGFTVLFFMPG